LFAAAIRLCKNSREPDKHQRKLAALFRADESTIRIPDGSYQDMALAISQVCPKQRGFSRCLDLGSSLCRAIKKGSAIAAPS
jgi:hypothetical protein